MKNIFIFIFLIIQVVYSDDQAKVCAAMSDDDQRLKCYDSLFKNKFENLNGNTENKAVSDSGLWNVEVEEDVMTNKMNVYLSLEGDPIRVDNVNTLPTMLIRCRKNKTELFISISDYVYLGSGNKPISYKLDNNKPVRKLWSTSVNGHALFYRGNDIRFIKKMMKHKKMVFEFDTYSSGPYVTTFEISGLKEAIKPLRKACGW